VTTKSGKHTIDTQILQSKTGICEICNRKKGIEIGRTITHHFLYDLNDPLKYSLELCYRCHTQAHIMKGEPGEIHRNKIRDLIILKYGAIPEPLPSHIVKELPRSSSGSLADVISKQKYTVGQDALTPDEYTKICETCSSVVDETLIKFTVSTGLRREDVVNVEWRNVKFENDGVCSITFQEKKKGNRIRTIHVGQKMTNLLVKYSKTCPKDQKYLFDFCGRTAYNKLQELCDVAKIRRRPFHALRATCVKRCQAAGWTLEQVADLTGDTIRVIQGHYATPSTSEMGEVAKSKEIV
jgi:integrase